MANFIDSRDICDVKKSIVLLPCDSCKKMVPMTNRRNVCPKCEIKKRTETDGLFYKYPNK